MIVNSGPFSASYKQIDYQQIYENTWDFVLFLVVIAAVFIFAYLYFSTNWRPFKIIGEDDCPECGNPLHHGSSKCKWCGAMILDRISDTTDITREEKPNPVAVKKQRSLTPYLVSGVIALVLVLIFVVKVDTSCLILYGIAVLLAVIYLMTQGPNLGSKRLYADGLAKTADGRAYTGKK